MKKILFFDTETAGLPYDYNAPITDSNNWPRLVQLGWIVSNINGEIIKERDYIIYPNGFTIPQESVEVHGITTQKAISEGYNLTIVLNEFMRDLDCVERIVGHNIYFDIRVVSAELHRIGYSSSQLYRLPATCTMESSTDYCKLPPLRFGQYKWHTLKELHTKLFGHIFTGVHNAMSDIKATKKCYFELIHLGIITDYPYETISDKGNEDATNSQPSNINAHLTDSSNHEISLSQSDINKIEKNLRLSRNAAISLFVQWQIFYHTDNSSNNKWILNKPQKTFTVEQFKREKSVQTLHLKKDRRIELLFFECDENKNINGLAFLDGIPQHPMISEFITANLERRWIVHEDNIISNTELYPF